MTVQNYNQLITGKLGRGRATRTLLAYAKHWGKEIPGEYESMQHEFFLASDASKILDDNEKNILPFVRQLKI